MRSMKKNKAYGVDDLPAEVIKNDNLIYFLTVLFNKCFEAGMTPEIWIKGILQSIPKSSTMDSRDPLSYCRITLTPAVYKMYCFTVKLQWLEHLWDRGNLFEKWVVRATEG